MSWRSSDVLDTVAPEDEQLKWHAVQQIQQAVTKLCTTQAEEIFMESFPDTPRGCYQEIWDRLQAAQERAARTLRKRIVRLAQLAQERAAASEEQQSHEKDPGQDVLRSRQLWVQRYPSAKRSYHCNGARGNGT